MTIGALEMQVAPGLLAAGGGADLAAGITEGRTGQSGAVCVCSESGTHAVQFALLSKYVDEFGQKKG